MATQVASAGTQGRNWSVMLLAAVCLVFGAVILLGGVWLILLGGSWYYGLAGAALIATGILLFMHRIEAVWLYLLTWAATVAWAFWEVGTDWWAQVPRLVAPTLILVLVLLCLPALRRSE